MKTLFNALKGINKFGLALVMLAATFVFTQSAFTSAKKKTTTEYVLHPTMGWQPKGSLNYGNNPGDYNCNVSISTICSGFFDDSNPPTSPSDQPLELERKAGQFYIVEDN